MNESLHACCGSLAYLIPDAFFFVRVTGLLRLFLKKKVKHFYG